MSKQLNLDEMLIAAARSNMPGLQRHLDRLQQAAQELATELAAHLQVDGPLSCELIAEEGCGLMGGFAPLHAGQPVPDVLADLDTLGEWEPRQASTLAARPGAGA